MLKANKDKCVAGLCDGYCTKPVTDGNICPRLLKRQKCYTCSRYITTPEYLVRLEEFEIQMNKDSSSDDIGQEIESLKKAKAHYAKLKFEIYDDYTRTNITREQMAKKTAEVKNKIAELDKMIAEKQELFDLQKDLFVDAKQEQLTKLSKLDKFDEDVIRNIIDYVLIYDNEHIEIKWNFDDFHIE